MAESNKILTVSYGTFSCTLEGFDDAFTTMKAIAEYFRDLAADDRFFGAEPPTPDPELLAKLASQSAARRVEARQSETGIVLRQDTAPMDVADAELAEDEVEIAVAKNQAAADQAEAEFTKDTSDADAVTDEDEATVAEDIATMAAVANIADEDDAPVADAVAAEAAPEVDAAPAPEATPAPVARPMARKVQAEAVSVTTKPARPAVRARNITHTAGSAAAARPASDLSSVAAKLQRIRDVVTKNAAAEADFSEDQHADETATDDDDIIGGRPEAVEADDALIENQAPEIEPEVVAVDEDDAVNLLDDEDDDDAVMPDAWMSADDASDDEDEDDIDLSAALAIANAPEDDADDVMDRADDEEAYIEDEDKDEDDALEAIAAPAPTAAPISAFEDEDEDDEAVAEAPVQDAPRAEAPVAPARPVARVLKVKRREVEAAIDDGDIEEIEEPQAPPRAYGDSTLDPEDEADLQNELKALEDEIAGRTAPAQPAAQAPVAAQPVAEDEDDLDADDDIAQWEEDEADEATAASPVSPRARLMDRSEGDMDRILAETNHHLGDSDGTRRRSAIAHLRAAVAATKAEKQAGVEAEDDSHEKADAYRDDLAQVVRPRRPAPRGDAPARRADDRPAPLKLVAAQRVDLPTAKADGPVTPRRVRVADLAKREEAADHDMDHEAEAHARASAANAASFTEFAERVGAYELPDILEAAASYLSFVEGREEFTRPQLMGKARQAMVEEFSREDVLRHFGRLLREGKLRKIAAGQFTVSDRINFRPEERAAG